MNIKAYRKKRGLTLMEMGDLVGIDKSTVHRHENGVRVPDLQMIQRYVEASKGRIRVQDIYKDFTA